MPADVCDGGTWREATLCGEDIMNGDYFSSFSAMFWAVNYYEIAFIYEVLHYEDNCHKVVQFLLIHIILFVRIMHDYVQINFAIYAIECGY